MESDDGRKLIKRNETITEEHIERTPLRRWREAIIDDDTAKEKVDRLVEQYLARMDQIREAFADKLEKIKSATSCPPA